MKGLLLRSLTESGIEAFRQFLRDCKQGAPSQLPIHLLTDATTSSPIEPRIEIDPKRIFSTKLELGRYLEGVLEPLWSVSPIDRDRGLWTAIALVYFDVLCPVLDGHRKVYADDRYILSHDYKYIYRHLARTPFVLTRIHGDGAKMILDTPPHTHGEATEQLMSRQQIYTNVQLFQAVDRLYHRGTSKKRGASSKGGGSLRRLGKVLKQYDLTFDVQAMSEPDIVALLPKEFERFLAA
jgi:hypothetical protein